MDKVSKLQKLLPYDWRIVNELKRELTADEYAVCVSWLAFMNLSIEKKNSYYVARPCVNISKNAQLDFLNFWGLGDEEVKTIYINKASSKSIRNDERNGMESKKKLNSLNRYLEFMGWL